MQIYIQDNPLQAIAGVDVAKLKRRFATNEKNVSKSFTTAVCACWSVQSKFFLCQMATLFLRSRNSWYKLSGKIKSLEGIAGLWLPLSVYLFSVLLRIFKIPNAPIQSISPITTEKCIQQKGVVYIELLYTVVYAFVLQFFAMRYPLWWWPYGEHKAVINDLDTFFSLFTYLSFDLDTSERPIACIVIIFSFS